MTELVRYEAARRALAEAVAVDEVKQIHDQAEALRHAARIAGDRDFEIKGAQFRFRAERRMGELLEAQKATVGLATGAAGIGKSASAVPNEYSTQPPKLSDVGIDRKMSSRAQRIAALPVEKFEALLEQHEDQMRTGVGRVAMDLLKVNADEEGRQARRELAKTLSNASAALPTGRQYPVIYADPPSQRKQGVTSRSYENHYPTMTWSEICALPVKDIVLPDAWLFLWIPRAHAFALHEIETDVVSVETGEVIRAKVKMPLAWAVAQSWGFDAYSTAFVWTKTDEDHPDEAGGAVLVRDQDELLLMFKRGRGQPKPDNGEKFGSNHRERSRPLGHSTKPQHYRRMIATMAGRGVPVLEMFARFDPENPAPAGWDLWGNQALADAPAGADAELPETGKGRDDADVAAKQQVPPAAIPSYEQTDAAASDASPSAIIAVPSLSIDLSEFDALKLLSDFCHPKRPELAPQIGPVYAERGLAIQQSATGQWMLREPGWTRLRELEAERRAREPAPAIEPHPLDIPDFLRRAPKKSKAKIEPQLEMDLARIDRAPPEVVDGRLQTRLPLAEDELAMQAALLAIDACEVIESEMLRHLIGAGFAHATTTRVVVTDEGRAFLAQLVTPAPAAELEARA